MTKTIVPSWDLSDLYKSVSDPKIKTDKKKIEGEVADFNKKYKDHKDISLLVALKEYSLIIDLLYILANYASLKFSENTQNVEVSSFYQQVMEFTTNISASLAWFSLLISKLDDQNIKKLQNQPGYSDFKHFIETRRQFKDFVLSEKEENIIIKKSVTGSEAFVKLYDQVDSTQEYKLTLKGKTQKLSYSQITNLVKNHPDRKVRQKAVEAMAQTLSNDSNAKIYAFILNTLLLDKKVEDELRGYKYPQESTFISYETPEKVVRAMIKAVTKSWYISERYYKAKSKLLGYKLYEWDRYSDIYVLKNKQKVDWNTSKQIILDSFSNFSPKFAEIASLFFEKNWIEAKLQTGKRGGAYCSYVSPSKHPYVFMNFDQSLEDVRTLGHELGHAIHGYLARGHNVLEFDASTAIAEIASIFAESVVFDDLISKTKDKKEKINLLASQIQGSFATIFRQTAFYLYEEEIHNLRRQKGELTAKDFSDLYQKHLQPMFGKGLTLTKDHQCLWMPIAHFYHYNFYVYTYAFGELLAKSLYAIYKKEGQTFIDKYIKALSAGGSMSPSEITKLMGVDISNESFWESGLKIIENEVVEFEKLVLE
ncbi:M3 family oligoendopeptidase [Candidatus Microgenomates bacterium]|nr:M3 family oligoendopeptidase [Candidatus Microgenomates bacterium]